ncbi:MAG: hypothetical protein AAF922_14365 [Pseudomonadota bacterium]
MKLLVQLPALNEEETLATATRSLRAPPKRCDAVPIRFAEFAHAF